MGPPQVPDHQSNISHPLLELFYLWCHDDGSDRNPLPALCRLLRFPAGACLRDLRAHCGDQLRCHVLVWLSDRPGESPLALGVHLSRALAVVHRSHECGTSYEMMFLFAVIYGIFDCSTVPPTASLVASHLGLRIMGLAMGLISGGHALG